MFVDARGIHIHDGGAAEVACMSMMNGAFHRPRRKV